MSNLKALLISLGSESSRWIHEELKKRFHKAEMINIRKMRLGFNHKRKELLVEKELLGQYDAVYIRGSFKYRDFLMSIASLLPEDVYTPISPESFLIMHNKLLTHLVLLKEKVPMPMTYIAPTMSSAKQILKDVKYPVMIKFLEGTQGKGVIFLESYAAASSFLDSLEKEKNFLIQEYIPSNGEDIRLIVTGDEVVAAMKRKAAPLEARSNYHAGGSVEKYDPEEETIKTAVKAAKAVGAEICGVDIIETELGPLVLEINASPGIQGITKATEKNVAGAIAEYIYRRTIEEKEKKKHKESRKLLESLNKEQPTEIITNLSIRAGKIVLPQIVSKITKLKDEEEVEIFLGDGYFTVKKS